MTNEKKTTTEGSKLRTRTQTILEDVFNDIPSPKESISSVCTLTSVYKKTNSMLIGHFTKRLMEEEKEHVRRMIKLNTKAVHAYKMYRNSRMQRSKKIAIVCAREVRRALMRTGKTNPCLKGRRIGRGFGVILRERKSKKRMQNSLEKKKEEKKEEEREQRKLNYLINQTELYAHFVLRGDKNKLKKTKLELTDDDEKLKEMCTELEKRIDGSKNTGNNRRLASASIEESAGDISGVNIKACLKEYQIKGVGWLINLYNQGINGILADDMGLGKTVQTLAFLSYLENKHFKKLFLIVTPASTLHNWESEIKRFTPHFKTNLYVGTDRNVSSRRISSPLIVLTTYQLIADKKLKRIKYDYLVCDEAQAIKSNKSRRWKNINEIKCRNRLLLTGTPIQNSMQELWSLLHFIMPELFDDHTLFLSWFSNEKSVRKETLDRLHSILKPFMLRREKRDVKNELGQKIERDVICHMTPLQYRLYNRISRERENENMVMQLRKIVNHPELYLHTEAMSGLFIRKEKTTLRLYRDSKASLRQSLQYTLLNCDGRTGRKHNMDSKLGIVREDCNKHGKTNSDCADVKRRKLDSVSDSIRLPDYCESDSEPLSGLRYMTYINEEKSEYMNSNVKMNYIESIDGRKTNIKRSSYLFETKERMIDEDVLYEEKIKEKEKIGTKNGVNKAKRKNSEDTTDNESISSGKNDETCKMVAIHSIRRVPKRETSLIDMRMCDPDDMPFVKRAKTMHSDHFDCKGMNRHLTRKVFSNVTHNNYVDVPKIYIIKESGKLIVLDNMLSRMKGKRILIYFQMTKMIDLFEEYVKQNNYSYVRLDGAVKISERKKIVNKFQTEDIFIFLLSTRAGGLGINLTKANTVIFYDSDWNPTVDQQAMDRAYRLGNTSDVSVYRLVTANSIEEKMRVTAGIKEEIHRLVIDGGEFTL